MTALPWLPTTVSTRRLEADLKARGWRVWWTPQASVRLFAPDGAVTEVCEATPAQTMRNAYASAQEYANRQAVQDIEDRHGQGLDGWAEVGVRA